MDDHRCVRARADGHHLRRHGPGSRQRLLLLQPRAVVDQHHLPRCGPHGHLPAGRRYGDERVHRRPGPHHSQLAVPLQHRHRETRGRDGDLLRLHHRHHGGRCPGHGHHHHRRHRPPVDPDRRRAGRPDRQQRPGRRQRLGDLHATGGPGLVHRRQRHSTLLQLRHPGPQDHRVQHDQPRRSGGGRVVELRHRPGRQGPTGLAVLVRQRQRLYPDHHRLQRPRRAHRPDHHHSVGPGDLGQHLHGGLHLRPLHRGTEHHRLRRGRRTTGGDRLRLLHRHRRPRRNIR